jgi:hypothetical protein
MLGHEDVTSDYESILFSGLFKSFFEDGVTGTLGEEWLPSITTEGDEVKHSALLETGQVFGHCEEILY